MMRTVPLLALLASTCIAAASDEFRVHTVAKGLEFPHGIAFLPDGDILLTEKAGRLRIIRDGRLLPTPVAGVPEVYFNQFSGLLDIVLHPRFAENGHVFLTLTQGSDKASSGHVMRGKYESGRLSDVVELLTVVPSFKHATFFGARMAVLPDETLLVTVGDGYDFREKAQDLGSTLGKVLRITADGKPPPDNPFVRKANARPEIWTYGHRESLGVLYDAVTRTVYSHENGPWGGDELNILQAGKNYGWPIATYGLDYSGAYVSPFKSYPGTELPLFHWTPSLAPSGLTQCRRCQWPEWEGDLFIGMLAGKQIRRVRLRENRVVEQQPMLEQFGERIRAVQFGPDGALYVLTDNAKGRVLKLTRQ